MKRSIFFINVPAFYVELLRLKESRLKSRPVAAVAIGGKHAFLRSVSLEARREGVFKGMSTHDAKKACRGLTLLPWDSLREHRAFSDLKSWVSRKAPLWEPLKPGHLFADFSGTEGCLGKPEILMTRLHSDISREFQFPIRMALASNKLVSRIAAKSLSAGEFGTVTEGIESAFLSPLPARMLPSLQGNKKQSLLEELNLRRVSDVQKTPLDWLLRVFGPMAYTLSQEAQGLDASLVSPPKEQTEISEAYWIEPPENDDEKLFRHAYRLLERALFRLRLQGKQAGRFTLTAGYSDGKETQKTLTLAVVSCWEVDFLKDLENLLISASSRRVGLRHLKLTLKNLQSQDHSQLYFSELQESLQPKRNRFIRLSQALDCIRKNLGMNSIQKGVSCE